ncbi:MAG: hypothetical protein IIY69_06595 [Clostridia bacterium]|nr:hypothetical protein [Clostridia bacterium]
MVNMYDRVKLRLEALGFTAGGEDREALKMSLERAAGRICLETNLESVPEGLFSVWADMAAGLFLREKEASGELTDILGLSPEVRSITEGDVSVVFPEGGSREARLRRVIDGLISPGESAFAAYRRMTW